MKQESLTKWIHIYISNIQSQGYSQNTIDAYERTLRKFAEWKADDTVNTTSQELLSFITELTTTRQLKPASLRQYEAALSAFYKFLTEQDIIMTNPMDKIKRPKAKNKTLKYLHHDEVMTFIEGLKGIQNAKYALIVRTIYATGMRISELCNLRIENIDFENELIQVLGKGGKYRIVCCEPETLAMIKEHIGNRSSGYVFEGRSDGRMSRVTVERIFKQYAPAGITPHKIRHSFATELYRTSHDLKAVQSSLGHSSIQTTEIYLHTDLEEQKRAYKFFPLGTKIPQMC